MHFGFCCHTHVQHSRWAKACQPSPVQCTHLHVDCVCIDARCLLLLEQPLLPLCVVMRLQLPPAVLQTEMQCGKQGPQWVGMGHCFDMDAAAHCFKASAQTHKRGGHRAPGTSDQARSAPDSSAEGNTPQRTLLVSPDAAAGTAAASGAALLLPLAAPPKPLLAGAAAAPPNSALSCRSFSPTSSADSWMGTTEMPRSRSASRQGSAAASALLICPREPAMMTGRVVPRKAARGITRSLPSEICGAGKDGYAHFTPHSLASIQSKPGTHRTANTVLSSLNDKHVRTPYSNLQALGMPAAAHPAHPTRSHPPAACPAPPLG